MALKIIKSAEPISVERINLCIYGQPGLGKTTLAFSAEDPLLLDFDHGSHRAGNRKDVVIVNSWQEVAELSADDLAPYKTVIVDTAGRALDFLTSDIIASDPKKGRAGALTLQGFGTLKARFVAWTKLLNTFGKDVVLVCHMDEQKNGDEMIERLDVQGGSKGEIYKSVDAMGRIFVRGKERVLDFSPRENSFGKNPGGFEVLTIADPATNNHFLADVIHNIKARLNELSEEQKAAMKQTEEWASAIAEYTTVEHFNEHLGNIKEAPKPAQMLFNDAAKKLGFVFNKTAHAYEVANAAN